MLCVLGIGGAAYNRDDFVNVVNGLEQAFHNMCARFRLVQFISRTPLDDLSAMLYVAENNIPQVQYARLVVDQRQHDDACRGL